jgi:hypothetical protein
MPEQLNKNKNVAAGGRDAARQPRSDQEERKRKKEMPQGTAYAKLRALRNERASLNLYRALWAELHRQLHSLGAEKWGEGVGRCTLVDEGCRVVSLMMWDTCMTDVVA